MTGFAAAAVVAVATIVLIGGWILVNHLRQFASGDERHYSILEAVADGMFIVDREWRFTHVNERAEGLLHASAADLVGKRVSHVLDALASDLLPEMRAAISSGIPIERTQYSKATDSWLEVRIQPASHGVVVYLRDVTARKHAETLLSDSEHRLRLLLGQVPALLWTVDLDMRFTSIVGAGLVTQGFEQEDLSGQRFEKILAGSDSKSAALSTIRRVFNGESARFETRHFERWLQHHVEPLRDADGATLGAIGVALDITEMKETAEHFAHLARIDALTQLPNRLALEETLETSMERARHTRRSLGILFVDVDRFKHVNDTLGHRTGDILLREFATRLRTTIDTRGTVFRSGGDEFIAIIELSDTLSIPMIAVDIRAALAQPFFVSGRELHITASIGTSTFPDGAKSAEELITHADLAMYRAKQSGRNTIKNYDPASDTGALYKLRLEQDLHRAADRGELSLVYQPIVSMADGRVIGAEALLRWFHAKYGEIPPEQFIAIAEETGTIVELSRWVLQHACEAAASVRRTQPDFRIAVNLSARDFYDGGLIATVREALRSAGLPAGALDIEITESTVIHESALQTLETLRQMGVRIVVDDFGVAYSSLGYLKRLPVGAVKIDRAFLRDITTDAYDQAIVGAIVSLAKTLDLDVIAEGIETEAQLTFARGLRIPNAQGFYFSRPVNLAKFASLLQDGTLGVPVAR
jgi:diguanylate cyclase (GGDEF)-like protein/PAS domain S-box-containing protein